jgi:cytochrome c
VQAFDMDKYLEELDKAEKADPTNDFAKQSARPHLFLSPEQLELLEERRIAEEKRMQKA